MPAKFVTSVHIEKQFDMFRFTSLRAFFLPYANSFSVFIFFIHFPLRSRITHQNAFNTWSIFKQK